MGRRADGRSCGLLRLAAAAGGLVLLMATAADAGTTYYHYDGLGRLVSVCDAASGKRIRYAYDANGNRTSWTVTTASCSANAAPVAVNDTVPGQFEVELPSAPYDPTGNDSDPDGDSLRITSAICLSTGCSVTVSGGRFLTVNATTGGYKQVQYTINDGHGGTASAVATFNFSGSIQCGDFLC